MSKSRRSPSSKRVILTPTRRRRRKRSVAWQVQAVARRQATDAYLAELRDYKTQSVVLSRKGDDKIFPASPPSRLVAHVLGTWHAVPHPLPKRSPWEQDARQAGRKLGGPGPERLNARRLGSGWVEPVLTGRRELRATCSRCGRAVAAELFYTQAADGLSVCELCIGGNIVSE